MSLSFSFNFRSSVTYVHLYSMACRVLYVYCLSLEADSAKSPAVEATSSPFCIHTMFVKEFEVHFSNFAQPDSLIQC